jgi:hypothetical protein
MKRKQDGLVISDEKPAKKCRNSNTSDSRTFAKQLFVSTSSSSSILTNQQAIGKHNALVKSKNTTQNVVIQQATTNKQKTTYIPHHVMALIYSFIPLRVFPKDDLLVYRKPIHIEPCTLSTLVRVMTFYGGINNTYTVRAKFYPEEDASAFYECHLPTSKYWTIYCSDAFTFLTILKHNQFFQRQDNIRFIIENFRAGPEFEGIANYVQDIGKARHVKIARFSTCTCLTSNSGWIPILKDKIQEFVIASSNMIMFVDMLQFMTMAGSIFNTSLSPVTSLSQRIQLLHLFTQLKTLKLQNIYHDSELQVLLDYFQSDHYKNLVYKTLHVSCYIALGNIEAHEESMRDQEHQLLKVIMIALRNNKHVKRLYLEGLALFDFDTVYDEYVPILSTLDSIHCVNVLRKEQHWKMLLSASVKRFVERYVPISNDSNRTRETVKFPSNLLERVAQCRSNHLEFYGVVMNYKNDYSEMKKILLASQVKRLEIVLKNNSDDTRQGVFKYAH